MGGLGAGGSLQLDPSGHGTFTLGSLGNAPEGLDIHIESSYNPRRRTRIRTVNHEMWNAVNDVIISFVGGDPQTTAGTVASIAGGILIVGDVGSIAKNLWRMTAFSDTEPNYVELSLGGLGVATTALAVTGVGAAVPVAIAPLKTLAIRLGNQGIKMLTVYIDLAKRTLSTGTNYLTFGHFNVITKMVDDVPVGNAFNTFKHTDDVANAVARTTERLGDAAESYYQGVRRAVETYGADGPKIGEAFVRSLDDLDDAAIAAFRSVPANQLDEAFDGLARVLSKGVNPQKIKNALNNPQLFANTQYTRVNLLKDLDELAVADVKGIRELVGALTSKTASVRGVRYELEGAAYLIRNPQPGEAVVEVTRKFLRGKKGGTDFDVVVRRADGSEVYYQFKSTRGAFGSFDETQGWVGKALQDLPPGSTYDQIRFAVPDINMVPPQKVAPWFQSLTPIIEVEVIPITP